MSERYSISVMYPTGLLRGPIRRERIMMHKLYSAHSLALLSVLLCFALVNQPASLAKEASEATPVAGSGTASFGPFKFSKGGIDVEMTVEPLSTKKGKSAPGFIDPFRATAPTLPEDFIRPDGPMEGEEIELTFRVTDSTSGQPIGSAKPVAWIDAQSGGSEGVVLKKGSVSCADKIQAFMQGSLAFQPTASLNTFYILALNDNASISVIDPQVGFYVSKLLTTIRLKSRGGDWVLSRDGRRLFVSMPDVEQVAAASTQTWKVAKNVDVGARPLRVALQPDERYVWVGNEGRENEQSGSGVTVIDAYRLEVVARIPTGAGHHELAFSPDSRYAFVLNDQAGTVSVIDTQKLEKVTDIETGKAPVSLDFSELAEVLYVAHQDGRIAVVDGKSHSRVATIETKAGLRSIRFAPNGGRLALAVNHDESMVYVIDTSTNRVTQEIAVEKGPDQVSFTRDFAYVRSLASENVSFIQLGPLEKGEATKAGKFPTGNVFPERSKHAGLANAMSRSPEGGTMLIANPSDKTIYYYMEGMLAPMGSFQNYGQIPRAICVVDKSLQEVSPGTYSTTLTLPQSGVYDLAFLLDSPFMHHCFQMDIKEHPGLTHMKEKALRIEYLSDMEVIPVNQGTTVRFKLTDPRAGEPKADLRDVNVMTTSVTGVWQKKAWAKPLGDGIYETEILVSEPGYYYVFIECPSQNVGYSKLPHLLFEAVDGSES